MNATQEKAIAKLREQQAKTKEGSPAWGVGEQLADICAAEPDAAAIILPDLENPDMGITQAERKIRALADEKHKKLGGGSVCVTPKEAEGVLRKFYGLPDSGQAVREPAPSDAPAVTGSFADFL